MTVGADYVLSKRTDLYAVDAGQRANGEPRTLDGGTRTQGIINLRLRHRL